MIQVNILSPAFSHFFPNAKQREETEQPLREQELNSSLSHEV